MAKHIAGQKEIKTAKDDFREKFKKVKLPDDFKSSADFLKYVVQLFDEDLEFDSKNRRAGINDAEFAAGDQWDDHIRQMRESDKKPTLTFNRLVAFIGQVVGGRRLNETVIKIAAEDKKFKPVAIVRQGLVRSIQKNSRADQAYNKAQENQVISGIGNFDISLEYAYDDVFEQDVCVNTINNTFSVVWDREISEPSGNDAGHVFKVRKMKHSDFEREWPDKKPADFTTNASALGYEVDQDWVSEDDIRVVDFWRMRTRRRIVALLRDEDGTEDVVDVTEMELEEFSERLVVNKEGVPIMREVDRKYAQLYTLTALDILEGPYELPIKRVPIFRVPAWEFSVGDKVFRFGLIRFLKDPQRLYNYWRSIIAEKLMLSPKGNWIASEEAVAGHEKEWRNSHNSNDPLLVYNGEAGEKPTRVPPTQIEAGLIEQAGMASQDLRDISNIHEAGLGQQSNEVSGKAIVARQRIGDVGITIYADNLELAIEECGAVINQLIPFVYNTPRAVSILGEEGEDLPAQVINDTTDKDSVDITLGKYKVSSITGPSTVTKRAEAADSMLNMVNAMPDTLAVAADKIIEAQDWPGSSEIARRIRRSIPIESLDPKDLDDQQLQQLAQQKQQAEVQAQQQQQVFDAELREKNAKAQQAEGLAAQANANAVKAMASINIDEFNALADVDNAQIKQIFEAVKMFQDAQEEEIPPTQPTQPTQPTPTLENTGE